jgi:hypothetical protein
MRINECQIIEKPIFAVVLGVIGLKPNMLLKCVAIVTPAFLAPEVLYIICITHRG